MTQQAGNTHIVLTPAQSKVFEDTMQTVQQRWIAHMRKKGIDGAKLLQNAKTAVQNKYQQ